VQMAACRSFAARGGGSMTECVGTGSSGDYGAMNRFAPALRRAGSPVEAPPDVGSEALRGDSWSRCTRWKNITNLSRHWPRKENASPMQHPCGFCPKSSAAIGDHAKPSHQQCNTHATQLASGAKGYRFNSCRAYLITPRHNSHRHHSIPCGIPTYDERAGARHDRLAGVRFVTVCQRLPS
jgi:hypothetical protein